MLSVGLTGGIGAGKSTVARHLAGLGARVLDADRVAREVVAPGTPGLAALEARFGPGVLTSEGHLDRGALAEVVFADVTALAAVNAIVHPLVARRTAELARLLPADSVVVHDIPLLVENHLSPRYHLVVVVDACPSVRTERLVRDRGMSPREAARRIASQASPVQRQSVADSWLDNGGSPGRLLDRVEELWHRRLVPFEENLRRGLVAGVLLPSDPSLPPVSRGTASVRVAARVSEALGRRAGVVRVVPPPPGEPRTHREDVPSPACVAVRLVPGQDPRDCGQDLGAAGFPVRADAEPDRWWTHGSADPGQPALVRVAAWRPETPAGARPVDVGSAPYG